MIQSDKLACRLLGLIDDQPASSTVLVMMIIIIQVGGCGCSQEWAQQIQQDIHQDHDILYVDLAIIVRGRQARGPLVNDQHIAC